MNLGLAAVAVLGGYIGYDKVLKPALANQPNPNNPPGKQPAQFWTDWFQQGDQPQTGNGPPTTDQTAHDWAQGITAATKFATSLVNYFGTAQDEDSSGGGTSTGGPTNTYGNGSMDWV